MLRHKKIKQETKIKDCSFCVDYKKDYIKKYAKKCKGRVPDKTYQAMMNWEIEITD